MKKLLTLEDLWNFYSEKNVNTRFCGAEGDTAISVQIPGIARFSTNESELGLTKVHLKACHTGENRNKSFISKESMEDALPSFKNRPILAYIYKDNDGVFQFEEHNAHLDEHGEMVYDEKCVGIIPESCGAKLSHDEEKNRYYVDVNGYIFDEYSKAAEILEREEECACSVELQIIDMSYNAKTKILTIEKFVFIGVTILGRDPDTGAKFKPGMEGANIKPVENFCSKADAAFTDCPLSGEEIRRLLNSLEEYNIKYKHIEGDGQEGGKENQMNKFEELLEKYGKTENEITFDYIGLSDEELEAKFSMMFGGRGSGEDSQSNAGVGTDSGNDNKKKKTEGFSIRYSDGSTKDFSLSLNEIEDALCNLVDKTYSELDGTYYWCIVYPDESQVVFYSGHTGKSYRQSYERNGDDFSLVGERIPVKSIWVSEEEEAALERIKANYSSVQAELETYKKNEILNSEKYASIKDADEVKELLDKKNEAVFSAMTADELTVKMNEIIVNYVTTGKFKFAEGAKQKPRTSIPLPINVEDGIIVKNNPYRDLFKKYGTNK